VSVPRRRGTPTANDRVRTGWIVDAVRAAAPSLPAPVVLVAVRRAAPASFGRAVIDRHDGSRPGTADPRI